ncbi:MAG: AfsR/SARP family transcriptional regulator [Pikeienuella sp.]
MTELVNSTDAALFAQFADSEFIRAALAQMPGEGAPLLVSDDADLAGCLLVAETLPFSSIALDVVPFDPHMVLETMRTLLMSQTDISGLVIDMTWTIEAIYGGNAIDVWGTITMQLSQEFDVAIVSLFNRDVLIENQMQAALRAHRQFLAPSGIYDNPHWLPEDLANQAPIDRQMAFLLGRAVPDYAGIEFFDPMDRGFARGAEPAWLAQPRRIQAERTSDDRWQIYCFGPLRVYREGQLVNWNLPGGAPKKTRTLFAYLLHSGEKGAYADRISELLWPEGLSEQVKRARLHHTVAMLRKTLGGKDTVLRSGDYYRLNAPLGSWTDISSFEQTCRRGLSLAKQGQEQEALKVYRSGVQLFTGDLFEDIPMEYVHSELEDWCLPRRRWLREMAQKLLRDMSIVMRSQDQLDEALEQCQKALQLDPLNEESHGEAMRVFHAQGRIEAIKRQYQQFISLAEDNGDSHENAAIHKLYRNLMH